MSVPLTRPNLAFWRRSLAGSLVASVAAPAVAWLILGPRYLLVYPVLLAGAAYLLGTLQGRSSGHVQRDWLWGSTTALVQLFSWALTASLLSDAGIEWLSLLGALPLLVVPAAMVAAAHSLLLRPSPFGE